MSFDPAVGAEIKKTRPALVLQNNRANRTSGDSHRIPFSEVDSVVLAAARGDAKAGMRLYKYHEFYTHDHPQAVRWLRVAAKTGDVEAALHLGLLLVEDEAPVEGLYWLQIASARGDEQAKAELWRLGQEPGSWRFGSPPK